MAKNKGGRKTTNTKSKNRGRFYRRNKKDKEDEEVEVVQVKDFENEEGDIDDGDDNSDDGDDIEDKETRKLVTQQNRKKKKSGGFQSMGLSAPVYRGIMRKGYKIPTPIQRKAMPVIMDGKDVVAMARTGSGKTAAFLIPMFEKLQSHSAKTGARALIMSPTRELALQTLKFIKELGRFTGIKAAVILGGDSFEGQFAAIHRNPDIIVATPGRFLHVIMEMDLKLSLVEYVVFDEADRLFEMGFSEQLHEIIHKLPDLRQTLLFSATLPRSLVDFAKAGLTDPALIRLDADSKISEQLKMTFFYCRADDKQAILLHLLQNVINPNEQTLIFVATKHHVEYLKELLSQSGITCSYVYSSLDQTARTINISKFQHKKTMVMVVTDVAARGIDIPMLDNVINFHFPAKSKLYVHRVGRVARAGRSGTAYSLVAMDEVAHMLDLHLFLGRPLKLATKDSAGQDGLFGRVPQSIIDEEEDSLRTAHDRSHDLSSLHGVCTNAYKQYIQSRTNPSSESVKRAKELVKATIAVHPVLGSTDDQSTISKAQLLDSVRNFKSRQTIFEVCPTAKSLAYKVMRSKRDRHGEIIEKTKQRKLEQEATESWPTSSDRQMADDAENDDDDDMQGVFATVIDPSEKKRQKSGSSNFRDANYIPHRSSDHYAEKGLGLELSTFEKEAAGSVIEINADDDVGLRKNKQHKKWDRKRKRFIGADEEKKKKIKTESGARIPATYRKDLYKNWLKKNCMDAPGTTRDTDESLGVRKRGKSGKFNKKGGARQGGKSFTPGQNELKSKHQILKARKAKEHLMQRQKMGKNWNKKKKMMRGR